MPAAQPSGWLISEFWKTLGRRKPLILGVVVAAAAVALAVTLLLPKTYTSAAVVVPVDRSSVPGSASLGSSLSGLASLTGLSLPTSASEDADIALATLASRAFLVSFARRHDAGMVLFASRFDQATGQWKDTVLWGSGEPTSEELFDAMSDRIDIVRDTTSALVSIEVDADSPNRAQEWATFLIAELNEQLRAQDIAEAQRSTAYLEQQIAKTSVNELRQIFYRLVEEQTKSAMLAEVTKEYALQVIDPPSIADEPSSPRPLLTTMLVAVAALLAVLSLLLIRFAFSSSA